MEIEVEAVEIALRDGPGKIVYVFKFADQKRFGLVAMLAFNDRGQIDVHDVAGL